MRKKYRDLLKKEFLDWAFANANNFDDGRFTLAQEIWIEKGYENLVLNKKIEQLKRQIKELEETLDMVLEENS